YVYTDGINGTGNSTLLPRTVEKIREPFLSVHLSAGAGKKLAGRAKGQGQTVGPPGGGGQDAGPTGLRARDPGARGSYASGGDLGEVLVYDRVLGEKELEQAERYLATRYNLPARQRVAVAVKLPEKAVEEDRRLIVELFLGALCREPKTEEIKIVMNHLATA